jgi:hypothetical protein
MPKPRSSRSGRSNNGEASPTGFAYPPGDRELVVIAEPEAHLRATDDGVVSLAGAQIGDLSAALVDAGAALEPLFGVSEDRLHQDAARLSAGGAADVPDLAPFYRVRTADAALDELAPRLAALDGVAGAYVKPAPEPAAATSAPPGDETAAVAQPPATADFSGRQGYLGAPPAGVNALWARTQAGGSGAAVQIIDVEGAWQLLHEDLLQNMAGVVAGTPTTDISWRNHGTAVFGEFGGDRNGIGIEGIAADATVRGASIFGGLGSAAAIRAAADNLNAGDVILIELHAPGPRFAFANRLDQRGYIAIEWWPDNFAAIRYAVSRGVVVVAAAGNGAEDLDDALYDQPATGFPATWRNPFNPANPSSESVIVGAGAPPPNTHGRNWGNDRSRLDFSNWGARVDAQGWGREVTTTGGRGDQPGDLQGGNDETLWYTDTFSGTSSASPIVVGALACIQGILVARGLARMTSAQAIGVLRATGSPQTDEPGRPATQRIGNRPDIQAAIAQLSPVVVSSGIATQYWDECLAYPPGSTASLWLFVDNAWRHLDAPAASALDMVQRAFLGQDSRVRVWYAGDIVVGLVVEGS